MRNCRHFVQLKTKANAFVCITWSFFSSFHGKFGYHAGHVQSKCGCIMALHNSRHSSGVKNQFFLYKNFNFWFICLMVFHAIDSPDIVSLSKQPKYVALDYWFISVSLYFMLRFPAFFNWSFEPKGMHFVLSSPRWLLYLLSTNHSYKLAKSLFNWCSIV